MLTQMLRRSTAVHLDVETLAETHYDAVWRFCFRRVGRELAADATQETFLTALRRASSFRGDSDAKTWLFGIALNTCRSLSRKQTRDLPLDEILELQAQSGTPNLSAMRLTQALKKVSPEHQEVVILHELDGFSYLEIAQMIEIPEGTVKSRLHHAFLALRRHLNSEEDL
ncbi:MAG: RNA polymerase sigma factor [Fimbriimonadaceae bacterium]|nr:RNA polymerase sigma factor [Fimbriimonadaceae bacterium]